MKRTIIITAILLTVSYSFAKDKLILKSEKEYNGEIINIYDVKNEIIVYFRIFKPKMETLFIKLDDIKFLSKGEKVLFNIDKSDKINREDFKRTNIDIEREKKERLLILKPKKQFPQKGTFKEYKNLPVLGITFIGSVYAGAQFLQMYNLNNSANIYKSVGDDFQNIGFESLADEYYNLSQNNKNRASWYKTRAIIASAISTAAFIYAIIPKKYRIPQNLSFLPTENGVKIAINF